MARIRSIHPGFAKSEDIAGPTGLSKLCRLHFSMLWTYCDDEGRGKDSTPLIKAECWPLDDDVTTRKVEAWMAELADKGRILRYTVGGRPFFQVTNWGKWQHPQKKRPSDIPPPPDGIPTVGLSPESCNGTGGLSPVVGEVEVEGVVQPPSPSAQAKAHPLPADFEITPEMLAWARSEAPGVLLSAETAKFRDYWVAQGGQRGRKTDWVATWRNWMRKAAEDRAKVIGTSYATQPTVYR